MRFSNFMNNEHVKVITVIHPFCLNLSFQKCHVASCSRPDCKVFPLLQVFTTFFKVLRNDAWKMDSTFLLYLVWDLTGWITEYWTATLPFTIKSSTSKVFPSVFCETFLTSFTSHHLQATAFKTYCTFCFVLLLKLGISSQVIYGGINSNKQLKGLENLNHPCTKMISDRIDKTQLYHNRITLLKTCTTDLTGVDNVITDPNK